MIYCFTKGTRLCFTQLAPFCNFTGRLFSRKEFLKQFRECDEDESGFIGASELSGYLQRQTGKDEKLSEDEVQLMMEASDLNGDGQLDIDEFTDAMLEPSYIEVSNPSRSHAWTSRRHARRNQCSASNREQELIPCRTVCRRFKIVARQRFRHKRHWILWATARDRVRHATSP